MKGLNGVKYFLLVALLIFFTVGCSSGGDDGIDGTGMRGTAAEGEPLANAEVIIRDVNGNTRSATTDNAGRYEIKGIGNMTAPFIVKVRKDAARSYYSILPGIAKNRMNTANIHPVSDVAARNWFTSKGRDIDSEFEADGDIADPPSDSDINALRDALTGLLRFAYADFNVDANFDFIRNDFSANGMGFDGLLDHATIVIKENKITIKIKDPETGFEGKIIVKFEMINDLSQADSADPSEPAGLLVVPASSSEMVVVWDASTDNIGVAGYNVYWGSDANVDEGLVTVPYPVFKHEGLAAAQTVCYAVEAVDGAGNVSTRTIVNPSTHCKQTQPDDGNPPDAPTNLQVSDSGLGSVNLTWYAPAINTDIIGYRVYRSVAGDAEQLHAATLLTNFEDIDVEEGIEYCYSVAAVDAAFQESAKTTPDSNSCATVNAAAAIPPVSSAAPTGGAYNSTQSVTLSCVASGGLACSIYYTTDGSDPVPQVSPLYTAPIAVSSDTTVKFIARDESGNNELVVNEEQYVIDTVAPTTTATPAAGTYPSPGVSVQLNCSDGSGSGCQTTFYTTDGSVPTTSSAVYSQPINIAATTRLQYFSVDNVGNEETSLTSDYTIVSAADTTPPVNGTGANFINNGDVSTTNTVSVSIDIAATDNVAVTHYCVMDNSTGVVPTPMPACWVPVTTPSPSYSDTAVIYNLTNIYQPNDSINVFVWFKDAQDNVALANFAYDTIVYVSDSRDPNNTTPANFINSGALTTRSASVVLSISANDPDDDLAAYIVKDSTTAAIPPEPAVDDPAWVQIPLGASYANDVNYIFSGSPVAGDTLYAHVWFKDSLGNISPVVATDDIQIITNVVYSEDFEAGQGNWFTDNGVWQVGTPTYGTSTCSSGDSCAGTELAGNYPAFTDSRLISPIIVLPAAGIGEEIHLRFMNWFYYNTSDYGQVQVQVYDSATTTWGAWESVGAAVSDHYSEWSLKDVDLTAYTGEIIRIAFFHYADRGNPGIANEAPGWYVDDIEVVMGAPSFTGDFESGWDDWGTDRGVWQVGTPTSGGSGVCATGNSCVGTHLGGNYGSYTNSRLVSATTTLPAVAGIGTQELHLRFMNWFYYNTSDYGQVQVQVWDSAGQTWGAWENVGTAVSDHYSEWSLQDVDLTAYSGETVRIGFLHVAYRGNPGIANEASGWYLDDIEIVTTTPTFTGDFESGWDQWGSDRGVWQVGTPTSGGSGVCATGNSCVGTHLGGNYGSYTNSRLVSAPTVLPTAVGLDEVRLTFQNWYSYSTSDYGQVQVQVWDSAGQTWGAWENVGTSVTNSSGWAQKAVDLTAYAGQTVRIAFLHVAYRGNPGIANESTGWYIDDIVIQFIPGP